MEPFIAKVTTDSWGFPNYGILTVSTWVFIYLICRAQRNFFSQNLTLGCMTKTLNQIIFVFFHQNQNIFSATLGIRIFF
jgi:hypothetical protein